MTDSATKRRMEQAFAIHRVALRLADERGLDGFTMDELAAEVGVSRRTLFNYVPSKMDAILGNPDDHEDHHRTQLAEFIQGGPTGELMPDLKVAVLEALSDKDIEPDDMMRVRRLLRTEPRFSHAVHERFEDVVAEMAPIFRQREGDQFTEERSTVAIRFVLMVFDLALDSYVKDPSTSMADHFSRLYDTLADMFR